MDPAPPPVSGESRAWVTIVVACITLPLAIVSVVLRTYTRAVLIKQFGADDAAAIFTLLLTLGCASAVLTNVKYGLGRHMATLDPETIGLYFRTFYVSIVFYNATMMSVKVTFLLQYYRVFAVRTMRIVVLTALGLIGCWSLSQLLVAVFTCQPIPKFWTPTMEGSCIPNLPFWYINAAGNIITDVAIFVLPLPVLGSLNLRLAQKLLLIGIFSLGFFTCAMSIIRIQYLHLSDDTTWDNVSSSSWSVTEISTATICACLPTLRPALNKFAPGLMSSRRDTKDSSDRYKRYYSFGRKRASGAPERKHDLENGWGGSGGGNSGGSGLSGSPNRMSRSASSQRGVLYAEELELHRTASEGDAYLSDRLEEEDEGLPKASSSSSQQQQQHYGPGGLYYPGEKKSSSAVAVETVDALDSAEQLGLKASVRTEIGVATPPPPSTWRAVSSRNGGIAVQRDVVLTQSAKATR